MSFHRHIDNGFPSSNPSAACTQSEFFHTVDKLAHTITEPGVSEHRSLKKSQLGVALSRRAIMKSLAAGGIGMALAPWLSSNDRAYAYPQAAGLDLTQVDPRVRPQDDLFRFVNGHWIDTFQLPPDKSSVSAFGQLNDANLDHLHAIIDGITATSGEQKKIKDLYNSVLNEAALDAGGLKNVTEQWKLVDAATNKDDLAKTLGVLSRDWAIDNPVDFAISADPKNSNAHTFLLAAGGLGLDRPYYVEPRYQTIRGQYSAFLAKIYSLASLANPAGLAKDVLNFETSIAQGLWTEAEQRDVNKTYNVSSLAALNGLAPGFNWGALVAGLRYNPQYLQRIIIDMPSYYTKFAVLWQRTELNFLKSWLKANILRQTLSFLPKAFRDARFDFYARTLSGVQQVPPRWKTGVSVVDSYLGDALGKLYVAQYFPPEAKRQVLDLIANLKKTYRVELAQSWLSPETKTAAINKLDAINTTKVGYPDHWEDYSALQIGADFFRNSISVARWSADRDVAKFPLPVDKTKWGMTPPTVNAYYDPSNNEIVFPAGILQPPFFNRNADPAVNYGGIGAVIGHEISHAFDDQGAEYDAQGNLNSWWNAQDKQKFKAITQRLAQQYNAFVPAGLAPQDHVNGPISVGENAADINGLKTSAKALRAHYNNGDPNGPISKELLQVLFLNWSRIYREKWRPAALISYLPTAVHSPGEARANQVVKNIDDFEYAFDTKPGDKEYIPPQERIHIW